MSQRTHTKINNCTKQDESPRLHTISVHTPPRQIRFIRIFRNNLVSIINFIKKNLRHPGELILKKKDSVSKSLSVCTPSDRRRRFCFPFKEIKWRLVFNNRFLLQGGWIRTMCPPPPTLKVTFPMGRNLVDLQQQDSRRPNVQPHRNRAFEAGGRLQ